MLYISATRHNPRVSITYVTFPSQDLCKLSAGRQISKSQTVNRCSIYDVCAWIDRFHIGRMPSCLGYPGAESYIDFNLVPHILRNACDVVDQVMPQQPDVTKISGDMTEYIVYVVTAEGHNSGTDGNSTLCIIGKVRLLLATSLEQT